MPLLPQLEVSSDTNTKSPAKASDAVTLVNLATTGVNPSPDAMNQEDAATKTTLEDVTIDLTGKITVTLDAMIVVTLVIMAVATGTVRAVIRDLVVTDTVEFGDSEEVAATETKIKKSSKNWLSRVKPHQRSEIKPVKN